MTDFIPDDWQSVRLTEAAQVFARMGLHHEDWPAPQIAVREHYDRLRRQGASAAAIKYLAHALPRLEAVAWAVRVLEDEASRTVLPATARRALDVAARWLGERTDAHRRAARSAADAIGRPAAEGALGLAVFYSGGSIAQPHQQAVMPPDHVAARYVVSAINQAAYRSADADGVFARALDRGEAVARDGLDALRHVSAP